MIYIRVQLQNMSLTNHYFSNINYTICHTNLIYSHLLHIFVKTKVMFKFSLILPTLLFFAFPVFSQTSDFCLKLVNKSNPDQVRYIHEGKRISLYDKNDYKSAGKLSIENDSIIMISDTTFFLTDVSTIRGKSTGLLIIRIFGGTLGAFGLMMVGGGAVILSEAIATNTLGSIILIPLGVIVTGAGVLATLTGISIAFVNGKKYDLMDKWDLSIVPVSEVPSKK